MNAQELAQELGNPGAQELLSSPQPVRLAYNGLDGFPRVIPIGFYWQDGRIVVCTATNAPKVRALAARPNVALTFDEGGASTPARALLVRGVATLTTVDGVADEYIAASRKSSGGVPNAEFEEAVRALYKQMVRISIEPQWARFFDFGAGRLPAFLQQLANDS